VIHLRVDVENTAELLDPQAYGAGALLRWESAPLQAGTFVEGGTLALEDGKNFYDIWDSAGVVGTWYRTRISDASGSTFSVYSSPRQGGTDVLTAAAVEELMATGLDPAALQGVIDREQDWLANDPRNGIGQLIGERTQTTWRPGGGSDPILLRRPADSVEVKDNGVARIDVVLFNNIRLEPLNGLWVGPAIEITLTPIDELQVKRVLLELIRLTLSASPYRSESTEGHSYLRPQEIDAQRAGLANSLHPALSGATSVRIRSRGDQLANGPRSRL
jgi:hypothetical protein